MTLIDHDLHRQAFGETRKQNYFNLKHSRADVLQQKRRTYRTKNRSEEFHLINGICVPKSEGGFALPSVLMLMLLVTTLLMFLITMVGFSNMVTQKLIKKKKLELVCYSTINRYLATDSLESYILIDSNNTVTETIPNQLGLLEEVIVKSKRGNDSTMVKYLLAASPPEIFNNALVWSDPNLRGSYAGNVSINGIIAAKTDKIVAGNIKGSKRTEKTIPKDKILVLDLLKPKLYVDTIFTNLFNSHNNPITIDTVLYDETVITEKNITNLLEKNTIKIDGDAILGGLLTNTMSTITKQIYITGNLMFSPNTFSDKHFVISSSGEVIIGERTTLKNCIIISDSSIIIADNCFLQNVQLFAKRDIIINNSKLLYPSILGLYCTPTVSTLDNKLKVISSEINGAVMLVCSDVGVLNNSSRIEVDEASRIQGLCYSENELIFQGNMYGTIYTYKFWYKKEPTEYINWMVDTKIDRGLLSNHFLLPLGFSKNESKRILKETWIY